MTPTQRSLAHLRREGERLVRGKCEQCGVDFVKGARSQPYRFCSRKCAVRGRSGPTRRTKVGKFCATCGQYYEVQLKRAAISKYCCTACMATGMGKSGENNPNFKNAGFRRCEGCDREYKSYNKGRRFCSQSCSWEHAPEESVRNGRRGYDAELRCCAELNSRGMSAYRSAASRGPFDVFAIGRMGAICVQVKRTKNESRRRQRAAVSQISEIGAPVSSANRKQMWCWVDKKGWFVVDVQPDGSSKEGWGLDWLGLPPVIQAEINTMRDGA